MMESAASRAARTGSNTDPLPAGTWRARAALAALVTADAIGLVALHGAASWAAVDWLNRATWTATPPELVVAAAVRLVALGAAYWVAGAVIWAVVTHRQPASARARHWTALPGIRRLVDQALAVSLVASSVLTPAAASAWQSPPIPVIVETDHPQPAAEESEASSGSLPPTGTGQVPRPLPETSIPVRAPHRAGPAESRPAAARTHTVQPGEHMWLIAVRHLESIGAPATDAEVAPYWVRLIDANCGTIRSGDPDLIYPGEVLTLPEVGE